MDIWNKYVEKNPDFKDLNEKQIKKVKNTFNYMVFEFKHIVRDTMQGIMKGSEPVPFGKEVPKTQIKPPKEDIEYDQKLKIGKMVLDAVRDLDLDQLEEIMSAFYKEELDRDLTKDEEYINTKSLFYGMALGFSLTKDIFRK